MPATETKRRPDPPAALSKTMSKKNEPAAPEGHYWPGRGFFMQNGRREWQLMDKETVRLLMIRAGLMATKDVTFLSTASEAMLNIQMNNSVRYAGPLAGWPAGRVDLCGFRILVTQSPDRVKPEKGKFPLWEQILEEQFGAQLPWFLGWCKAALERVTNGGGPLLPALCLAGVADVGKSLAQNHLITPLLGGRMAKPWRYWTGETTFNEDLCGAEHLMVEDDVCPVKTDKRRMLMDALKNAVANETASLHPKGDKALTVRCLWAISISINEEPHNLRTLPLLDSSMNDKLILLRVLKRPDCLPIADDYEKFAAFSAKLAQELPAFAHFLKSFRVPKIAQGTRSLVNCYRDPQLMALVNEDDPVTKLVALLDASDLLSLVPLEKTSSEVENLLRECQRRTVAESAARLFANVPVGHLLREAAKRFPQRVENAGYRHGNFTLWRIHLAKEG